MVSMLVGRPISAVGGLLVLILLSRYLPPREYGVYFALWALIEIIILCSNFGLLHAVYRYVSAVETIDRVIIPDGPVGSVIFWRCITLFFAGVFINYSSSVFLGVFDLENLRAEYIKIAALIIFCEGMARFFEVIFDSMLCQGRSQITLVSRTMFRLLGILYLLTLDQGRLHIEQILLVELVATALGALFGAVMLQIIFLKSRPQKSNVSIGEKPSFQKMTRFALPAFIAQVLGLLYGPDALKLVLSSVGDSSELAIFGFAYSLAAVVQRYIPANLLAGLFRPLFVAAAKKDNSKNLLSDLLIVCIKINWLVIAPLVCAVYLFGDNFLLVISNGNYRNAGIVLLVVVCGLLAVAVHLTLSQYCLAIENSWPPLIATALAVVGLPLGFVFGKHFGALGVAVVFGVAELIWCGVCASVIGVRRRGFSNGDFLGLLKIIAITFISVFCVEIIRWVCVCNLYLLGFFLAVIFGLLLIVAKVFNQREIDWAVDVLPFGSVVKRVF